RGVRGPRGAASGPRRRRRRSGPGAAALGAGRGGAARRGRHHRPGDPHRPGAEAGRGHGALRRAALRDHRLARGAELARMGALVTAPRPLALSAATVRRGSRTVLEAVSFAVASGEMVGVVGANGAGKTTLLRAALGLAHLAAGRAELAGHDVERLSE